MGDKSPRHSTSKKSGKSVKQKRAVKKAKNVAKANMDFIAEAKRH
ncbi:MAG TPA: hypothetical protein VFX33_13305 [Actinomycetales bacterium]|nr:hypothetical protein [Actinomycetales bacterium]